MFYYLTCVKNINVTHCDSTRHTPKRDNDPSDVETLLAGNEFTSVIAENRKTKRCDLVENMDVK